MRMSCPHSLPSPLQPSGRGGARGRSAEPALSWGSRALPAHVTSWHTRQEVPISDSYTTQTGQEADTVFWTRKYILCDDI